MQRFGRQHVNGSQKLLRSARNQLHTNLPLIRDSGNRKRIFLIRSELLGQFLNTLTADIYETENLFSIFNCVCEIYVKFGVF